MTPLKSSALALAVLLAGSLGSTVAEARPGRHFHGARVVFFAPVFVPRYYYPSPYYYPPPYYYPAPYYAPQTYIEQPQSQQPPAQPRSEAYWYFCPALQGYYPHVRQCLSGWQRVAPTPPPS